MAKPLFSAVILSAPDHASVRAGEQIELYSRPPWVLGRAPHVDVVLGERSVSREHVIIREIGIHEWVVENVSSNNGVFLNGKSIATKQSLHVEAMQGFVLQVGRIVLETNFAQSTVPFEQAINLEQLNLGTQPLSEVSEPFLTLHRDGGHCSVICQGKLLVIKDSCALALDALCQRPGEVIHGWDLLDMMGEDYDLPQAISGIRRAFRALLSKGEIQRETLVEFITETKGNVDQSSLHACDDAGLMRHFILSRRGHGYAIMIPAYAIERQEQG